MSIRMNIRSAALVIGVICAVAADQLPEWEPLWVAAMAFVTGMAYQSWWIEVVNGERERFRDQ